MDIDYIKTIFNSIFMMVQNYISLTNDNFESQGIDFKVEFSKKIKFSLIDKDFKDFMKKITIIYI